jgi:hypothetical protein
MIVITIKYIKKMTYKLIYANSESWYFPSRALCNWKKKQLKASGNYSREFKIEIC